MLAMDIGNTHARLVRFAGREPAERRKWATRDLDLAEVAAALSRLASGDADPRLWIASVAPDRNALVAGAAEKAGIAYRFVVPGRDEILPHRLRTPETTGADRLLSALAAGLAHFPGVRNGYVVIQCGSAATIDWVDRDGFFRGGFILPGPALWLSGLAGAAQLPNLSKAGVNWDDDSPGASSRVAMLHGLAAGLPAAVAAAARRVMREVEDGGSDSPPEQPPVVVTGGWGGAVRARLGFASVLDEDLVLRGIYFFAERESAEQPK